LAAVHRLKDRMAEALRLGNLGNALREQPRRAIEYFQQSLTIARVFGDPYGEGKALWSMSLALDKLNDRTQAIGHAKAALEIFEQMQEPLAESVRKQLSQWRTVNEARKQILIDLLPVPHPSADPNRAARLESPSASETAQDT
jgi:tetratricopeptide (TPR) repeat protein